jgi:hypothetical protein
MFSDEVLASDLLFYQAQHRERVGRPERSARFHAGGLSPPEKVLPAWHLWNRAVPDGPPISAYEC